MYFVASKSFTSAATWTSKSFLSNFVIGAIPFLPSLRPSQKLATSFPKGVIAPIPVITTRFIVFLL